MNSLADFHFIRPWWLLLLPLAWLLWALWTRSADPLRGWRAVINADLLKSLAIDHGKSVKWSALPLLAGWTLAVIAVAGPAWRPEPSPFADDPVPVMIVLKAGESMDLSDLSPSRMERARLKVADFANERKGQPLGLIAYAGSSHLVLPPTRDGSVVATMAAEVSPAIMPKPGDALITALRLAADTLSKQGGAIVVLTDTIPSGNETALKKFGRENRIPIHFLAIARAKSPELGSIESAASHLGAGVVSMTPDSEDVTELARKTASVPVFLSGEGEGVQWEEAGWWIVPALALLVLLNFRREKTIKTQEVAA